VLPEQAHGPGPLARGRARAGWRATAVGARAWRLGCWILATEHSGGHPLRRPRLRDAAHGERRAVAALHLRARRCGRAGHLSRTGQYGPYGLHGAVGRRCLPS
jgi:hypothetical protein